MAINKDDFDMAKWILDQAIYHSSPLSLQDAMMVRAFLSALEEHRDAPSENVRSREWRAMVYRKLLEDPAALSQFTQEALRKYTPDELVSFLHPSILQALKERLPTPQETFKAVLSNISSEDLFEVLKSHGRIPDIIDYILDDNPDYAKDYLGWDKYYDEGYNEGRQVGQAEGHESGTEEGYNQGHHEGRNEGLSEGYEKGLENADG